MSDQTPGIGVQKSSVAPSKPGAAGPDGTPNVAPDATDSTTADPSGAAADAAIDASTAPGVSPWSRVWQIPTILASLTLITLALLKVRPEPPARPWEAALDRTEEHLAVENLGAARETIESELRPAREKMDDIERGRYHAALGDWVGISQENRGESDPENNRIIDEQFVMASRSGMALSPERLERWARARIDLGQIIDAREIIGRLETLAYRGDDQELARDAKSRRGALLRHLLEDTLNREGEPLESKLELLARFRDDAALAATDLAWAMQQEAKLRIDAGDASKAVERLLLDMRRLEGKTIGQDQWGMFYTLLAEAWATLGRPDDARYAIEMAFERYRPESIGRLRAQLLRGKLAYADADWEAAFNDFDFVTGATTYTGLGFDARLARSETASMLGDHTAALDDARWLADQLLPGAKASRDVDLTVGQLSASLADRYDAAVTRETPAIALPYVQLAESLFDAGDTPPGVLFRIAAAQRAIADELIVNGRREVAAAIMTSTAGDRTTQFDPDRLAEIPMGAIAAPIRARASDLYIDAGEHFIRHARATAGFADDPDAWRDSLFRAAEAFDEGGERDRAIQAWGEFRAGVSTDDPRRTVATWRMAQAHDANGDAEGARVAYQQVIDESPSSESATRSVVPLARVLNALSRPLEAEQVLTEFVEQRGAGRAITPENVMFRDAMVALGDLLLQQGRTVESIERYEAAALRLDRYTDGTDSTPLLFRLADARMKHADEIQDRLAAGGPMAPSESRSLAELRQAQLQSAREGFRTVCDAWDGVPEGQLDRASRLMLRNAWMGRARSAYEQQDFRSAATLYDRVARRYADDVVSMRALVQIINCFEQLGEPQRAEAAHRQARLRLDQLSDEQFESPGAFLERSDWERWLIERPVGALAGADAGGGAE